MAKHKIWIGNSGTQSISSEYDKAAINYDDKEGKSIYLRKESKILNYQTNELIEGSNRTIGISTWPGAISPRGVQNVFMATSNKYHNRFTEIINNKVNVFSYLGGHQDIYDYSVNSLKPIPSGDDGGTLPIHS